MLHFIVVALFLLLVLSVISWVLVYRRLDPKRLSSHPLYRLHQVLLAIIMLLAIVLAVVIVLSSDPGDPENYLFWP